MALCRPGTAACAALRACRGDTACWRAACLVRRDSSSSSRWMERRRTDQYQRQAVAAQVRSRAAFKLDYISSRHGILKPGQTVVDLGFAPGSWSQLARRRVTSSGRVFGVDVLPCRPPDGVTTFQGNILSRAFQEKLAEALVDNDFGRVKDPDKNVWEDDTYLSFEVDRSVDQRRSLSPTDWQVVDVLLSDMSEPRPLYFFDNIKSILTAYDRLPNISGLKARDHGYSMDLCDAALLFAVRYLRKGGSFVCKFYTGSEDKGMEKRCKRVFDQVQRIKPNASRKESKEAFFVGLNKIADIRAEDVFI